MKKPKIFIAFVGLDGSGKTTLARAAQEILGQRGLKTKYRWAAYDLFLLRPLVKGLKRVLVGKEKPGAYEDHLHSVRRAMRPRLMYLGYFYLILAEYIIEIFFKVRIPLLLGRSVVADRYVHDTATSIAANLNFSFGQYQRLIKKLLLFSPKPDMVCYVSIPEAVAIKRKKDIPHIGYLKLRNKYYQELAKNPDIIELDGRESPEKLKKQLTNILETVNTA